eukprot:TRINITY_DN3476_c0_g1_i1.p1 TRINITY_DN3476_c0_g1~~TRINITY_DN3476_c0_g1_i1.p1  ORF type:complete len:612 (+),score=103.82 TRINITY_DN3476_c0_g1_i1:87-1922(+)
MRPYWIYVSFAVWLTLPLTLVEVSGDCGPRNTGAEIVEVLVWSGGSWAGLMHGNEFKAPNYLGHDIHKADWKCPIDCRFTRDKRRVSNVDGVIFEAQPITSYYDEYKWKIPPFPQKYSGQLWFNHGYETHFYFNIYGDRGYMDYIDGNFTFYLHSQVPITFTCLWGGGNMTDFLKPHPPKTAENCVVFMCTNCNSGGAVHRTAYAKELMKHIDVHSYGKCLHNRDFPPEMQFPIYKDHGASMRNKISIFKNYKFVLVFENNNVTDYVTEKMTNVLQAGSVPVYMGAPNVHPYWTPGENAIVRTDDFGGPKELAEYLKSMCADDEAYEQFFEWKKKGLSQHYQQRLSDCVFYGAECRLCQYIAAQRAKLPAEQAQSVLKRRSAKVETLYAAKLNGINQYLSVSNTHGKLDFENSFTIGIWIKSKKVESPILDRGIFSLKLVPYHNHQQAFPQLCILSDKNCFASSLVVNTLNWQHIVAIFDYKEDSTGSVKFWINGAEDKSTWIPLHSLADADYSKDVPLVIGADHQKKQFFSGYLDELVFWDFAVDAKRAKTMVYDAYAGHEPGLAAYWPFTGTEGDRLLDVKNSLQAAVFGDLLFEENITKPLVTVHPFL